jgi:hypothetical protein
MAGFIFYRGPSMLDGKPIIGIAVYSDNNRKTGAMVQTYIMRAKIDPITAAAKGYDSSVCGDCKARPFLGGYCYVNLGHGPRAVYDAFKCGIYGESLKDAASLCEGKMVRMGAYGDPMAIPYAVWKTLLKKANGHTGYTHQWLNADVSDQQRKGISSLCMASADTPTEAEMARSIGLRTFRVRAPNEDMMPGEFMCPASEEAGKRMLCERCRACDGAKANKGASPTIIVHGYTAKRFIPIAQGA